MEEENIAVPKLEKMDRTELAAAFVAWVAEQQVGDAGTWLANLDASGQATLTNEIAGFCQDAGFDLAWVIQSQIDREPLLDTLRESVLGYLAANYKASTAQPALTLHKTVVAWLNQPTARKYRPQTRQIYVQLVEAGIIPKASAETLLETDKSRWLHVASVLQTAYQQDPDAVSSAVKAAILDQPTPSLADRIRGLRKSDPQPVADAVPATVAS